MNIYLQFMLDYLRIVGYTVVIVFSLLSYYYNRPYRAILIGNFIFALFSILAVLDAVFFKHSREIVVPLLITPAAVIWAIFHLYNFLKKK